MATTTEQQMNALLDYYGGGLNGGPNAPSSTSTGDFSTHSAAPNEMAIAQALGIDPTAASIGMTGLTSMMGPVGTALGVANSIGNAVNTSSNTNMLGSLGTSPSAMQSLGGAFGMNALAGNYTGALNMALGDKMSGFQGMEIGQAPGDYGPGFAGSPTASPADVMAGYGPGAVSSSDLGAPSGGGGNGGGGSDNGNGANDNSGGADPGGAASEAGFARGGLVMGNRLAQGTPRTGLIQGAAPGQADSRQMTVPRGAYVAPAAAVAAVGQGNTSAGAKALDNGAKTASGADPVQANVSDGEFVIDPARVMAIGGGDMKLGAARLDHLFSIIRQHGIDGMIPEGRPFVLENLFVRKSA
ncbi:MAG TPA: hypothetical protein VN702_17540 [Acetobacteraceae bacterium]|nr:hypothetical protein [Acetobacteraceae bacterium]